MDPLLATGRLKHGQKPAAAPRGRIPKDLTPKQRMTRKLQTLKGKADYARRKAIVEPVFGQMKVAQHAGQFRLQGTDKTNGEWALHTVCHNLRKLQNAGWTPPDGDLKGSGTAQEPSSHAGRRTRPADPRSDPTQSTTTGPPTARGQRPTVTGHPQPLPTRSPSGGLTGVGRGAGQAAEGPADHVFGLEQLVYVGALDADKS